MSRRRGWLLDQVDSPLRGKASRTNNSLELACSRDTPPGHEVVFFLRIYYALCATTGRPPPLNSPPPRCISSFPRYPLNSGLAGVSLGGFYIPPRFFEEEEQLFPKGWLVANALLTGRYKGKGKRQKRRRNFNCPTCKPHRRKADGKTVHFKNIALGTSEEKGIFEKSGMCRTFLGTYLVFADV